MVMNKENILITVITVCYNSEKTIEKSIQSVLNQTTNNFEYIIVDGKSTDNTVKIIKSFEEKFRAKNLRYKWISEKDTGIYNAFNKGIKLSNGSWISFLGSDDFYVERALTSYEKHIEGLKFETDFIHSNIKINNKICFKKEWKWKEFKRSMSIAHAGGFHSAEYFQKYGLFNVDYKIAADYELLLRAKEKLKTSHLNELTLIMSNQGVSNKRVIEVYQETTKAKINLGLNKTLSKLDFIKWVFKYKVKNILHAVIR